MELGVLGSGMFWLCWMGEEGGGLGLFWRLGDWGWGCGIGKRDFEFCCVGEIFP